MAPVISNYDNGQENQLSGQCEKACSTNYSTKYHSLRFNSMDSIVEKDSDGENKDDPGELVVEGLASGLDECDDPMCSACSVAHMSNFPDDKFPICTDERRYRYTNKCRPRMNQDLCTADDPCFISWPADDEWKWKSKDKACRPLPRRNYEGEFKEGRNSCKTKQGTCGYFGCDGRCKWSWPIDDEKKWKSDDRMCRCFDEL